MLKKSLYAVLTVLIVMTACATKTVQDATAPPLKVAQWVKGAPVALDALKGKKAVVIEFWATWCPPCRESIPHLTALQKKYRDSVAFIGISNEAPEDVKRFVEAMGSKMDYAVAIDDKDETSRAYMDARGVNTIPYAFVVGKDGNVAYHGHPLDDAFEAAVKKAAGN